MSIKTALYITRVNFIEGVNIKLFYYNVQQLIKRAQFYYPNKEAALVIIVVSSLIPGSGCVLPGTPLYCIPIWIFDCVLGCGCSFRFSVLYFVLEQSNQLAQFVPSSLVHDARHANNRQQIRLER